MVYLPGCFPLLPAPAATAAAATAAIATPTATTTAPAPIPATTTTTTTTTTTAVVASRRPNCDSCRRRKGLRLPICDSCRSCRGSVSLTVTAGEVAEAHAPKLRQQLESAGVANSTWKKLLNHRWSDSVRKRCKYCAKRRCRQEGFNTCLKPEVQHLPSIKTKDASCTWGGARRHP